MEYISVIKDDVDIETEHRYLRLPHPRTGQPQLYLSYTTASETQQILEVVKINCSQRRTWFIGESGIDSGSILLHVPVDPLFLVIPIILSLLSSSASSAARFQPLGDLIAQASVDPGFALPEPFSTEPLASGSRGFNEDITRLLDIKPVRRVLRACCEKKGSSQPDSDLFLTHASAPVDTSVVPTGPPSPPSSSSSITLDKVNSSTYYRPSTAIIINHLKRKIEHFAQPEQYEKFDHLVRGLGRDGLLESSANQDLLRLARLKGSIEHMAQYLPPSILKSLHEQYDFTSLSTYSANRTAAQIAASAPITQSKSEAAAALKAGTKRKGSQASRGVESLKKVNTSSMSKLTSFFKPKDGDGKKK